MSKKAITRDESESFNVHSGIDRVQLIFQFSCALANIEAACKDGEAVQWDRVEIDTSTEYMDDSSFVSDFRMASWRTVRIDAPIVKVEQA